MFSGPSYFNVDFALSKAFKIYERHQFEFRAQAINVLNHPTFYFGDQSLDDATFGNSTSTLSEPRRVSFSLKYSF